MKVLQDLESEEDMNETPSLDTIDSKDSDSIMTNKDDCPSGQDEEVSQVSVTPEEQTKPDHDELLKDDGDDDDSLLKDIDDKLLEAEEAEEAMIKEPSPEVPIEPDAEVADSAENDSKNAETETMETSHNGVDESSNHEEAIPVEEELDEDASLLEVENKADTADSENLSETELNDEETNELLAEATEDHSESAKTMKSSTEITETAEITSKNSSEPSAVTDGYPEATKLQQPLESAEPMASESEKTETTEEPKKTSEKEEQELLNGDIETNKSPGVAESDSSVPADVDLEAADEDIMKTLDENIKAAEEEVTQEAKAPQVENGPSKTNEGLDNKQEVVESEKEKSKSDVDMEEDNSSSVVEKESSTSLTETVEEEKPDFPSALDALDSIAQTNKRILDEAPEPKKAEVTKEQDKSDLKVEG